jgi:hypothetical protein
MGDEPAMKKSSSFHQIWAGLRQRFGPLAGQEYLWLAVIPPTSNDLLQMLQEPRQS